MREMNEVWVALLSQVIRTGRPVSPRGMRTYELAQHTITVDMRRPVLTIPERKMSYRFMAREAWWILTGDDRTETIVPWNKNLAKYSDDGIKFFGAYGPKVVSQLDYVVSKLVSDPDTRQAGLTIWRENPPQTKDVPCTVAVFFSIRNRRSPNVPPLLGSEDKLNGKQLEVNVFMRSNDVWLGTPYDVFNFSMLGHLVCALYNEKTGEALRPGPLRLMAASMHIYEENVEWARHIVNVPLTVGLSTPSTPDVMSTNSKELINALLELSDTSPGDKRRWWEGP